MSDDPVSDAITSNATSPQSMSADGISVTNNPISEQIAAKKFLDANAGLQALANGGCWFPGVIIVPPGAGGTRVDDDC